LSDDSLESLGETCEKAGTFEVAGASLRVEVVARGSLWLLAYCICDGVTILIVRTPKGRIYG
jgi:hypothetical protein